MKSVLSNSVLILLLTFLFGLPVAGFGFIDYEPKDKGAILGDTFPVTAEGKNQVEVVDQLNLSLKLSNEETQVFYNVIPEGYIDEGYELIAVRSKMMQENGIEVELVENELTTDLVVYLPVETRESLGQLELTILVLE